MLREMVKKLARSCRRVCAERHAHAWARACIHVRARTHARARTHTHTPCLSHQGSEPRAVDREGLSGPQVARRRQGHLGKGGHIDTLEAEAAFALRGQGRSASRLEHGIRAGGTWRCRAARPAPRAARRAHARQYLVRAGVVQEEDHNRERDDVHRGACAPQIRGTRVTRSPAAAPRAAARLPRAPHRAAARAACPHRSARQTRTRARRERSRSRPGPVPARPAPATCPATPWPRGSASRAPASAARPLPDWMARDRHGHALRNNI